MLGEELPEHRAFEYTYRAVEGRMAFLEWAYEDANVRVRDGADSYLIEDDLVSLHTRCRLARGSCAVAAQLVGRPLAPAHGLFALPEGHRQHLAALAVGEGSRRGRVRRGSRLTFRTRPT